MPVLIVKMVCRSKTGGEAVGAIRDKSLCLWVRNEEREE